VDDTKGYDSADGKAEAWGPNDAPGGFNPNLEYRLASLPLEGQATNIPWAGNYWPTYQDNINHKWDGPASQSPATKFGAAFNVSGVETAVSQNHGIDANTNRKACTQDSECTELKDGSKCAKREGQTSGRCIPTWWGICHAWTPAAILLPEPKYPVTVNGVTFKVQDVKALVTLAFDRTNTKFVSLRCNKDLEGDSEINFDKYGRPDASSPECEDTNAGTMHILLANYLGLSKAAFAYDRTIDDEVWNQPIRGFKVTQLTEVSSSQANALVGVTAVGGTTHAESGAVAKNEWKHFGPYTVAAGQTFKVAMKGTGDADLHVKLGAQPTTTVYDCRPYDNGSTENCELTVPAGQTQAFVSVQGYAASSTFELQIVYGGQVPVAYEFNPKAVKFFQVKAEVKYISESPAHLDGNLGDSIDTYTHTDHYDYVLEVDADGKIIGGEWLFDSKLAHPDFLWLPLSVGSSSVAGGKISYARVKQLHDASLVPPGGSTPGGGDKVVNESATLAKNEWKQYGPFTAANGLKAVMSGSGDADLYVRRGAAPTTTSYDCRPYKNGSAEECTVTGAGTFYVGVRGYATSSSISLVVTYSEGGGTTPTPSDPPATVTHLNVTDAVAAGEMKYYSVDVIAGRKIVIKTACAKDIDLYTQMNAQPTTDAYLARGYTSTGNETITFTPSSSGKLWVGVHGYEAAPTFTLTTSD
jgi:hypothetical protein